MLATTRLSSLCSAPRSGRYDAIVVRAGPVIETQRPQRFDVICAGHPLWRASKPSLVESARALGSAFVNVTKMMSQARLRVGWATALEDDRLGRALLADMAAIDVAVRAVKRAPVDTDLVVVDASGGWSGLASDRGGTTQVEIPPSWSSQVLLLSGLTPVTSSLAAFSKAARRARRDGTVVVLDLVGSLRDWNNHDPRVISMVLRDADVVRCNFFDLAVIRTDTGAVRRAMRSSATLVLDDESGATAVGPFGEVRVQASRESGAREILAECYTAAVCVEYARPRGIAETPEGRWHRVLRYEAPRLATSVPLTRRDLLPPSRGRR
jgi:sugar/nucleoside kinase (ribokinase family)